MTSKMTDYKADRKKITSRIKNNPNYETNNKKIILKKLWLLLVVIFIVIGIFSSIKKYNNYIASIYSEPNKDTFEQATKAAKAYWRFAPLYRDDIIDQLIYEGFTYDEAVYALEENDY
ncbi:Ltp family lipoprotein [Clostridium sp. AL.422]|uniref:Ltp family lipoprotein n=1 Tax=Clostridium TaxID=1485 RepID=UPI00293DCF7B|nr:MULTISPECIES: Ltp family lipoprotein [unclassified Clostridium]MDV4150707.1 Ltp family lipoprotein [Clostridium sp. AL.422]